MKNNEEKLAWKSYEEKVLEHLLELCGDSIFIKTNSDFVNGTISISDKRKSSDGIE